MSDNPFTTRPGGTEHEVWDTEDGYSVIYCRYGQPAPRLYAPRTETMPAAQVAHLPTGYPLLDTREDTDEARADWVLPWALEQYALAKKRAILAAAAAAADPLSVLVASVPDVDELVRDALDLPERPTMLEWRHAPLPPFDGGPTRIVVRLKDPRGYRYEIAMPWGNPGQRGWVSGVEHIRPQDVDAWVALDGEQAVWGMEGIAWGDLPESFRASYMHALASFLIFSPAFRKPLAEALAQRLLAGKDTGTGRRLMDRLRDEAATKCRKRVDEIIGKTIGSTMEFTLAEKVSDDRVRRIVVEALDGPAGNHTRRPRLKELVWARVDDLLDDVVAKEVRALLSEDIERVSTELSRKVGRSVAFTLSGLGDKLKERFED